MVAGATSDLEVHEIEAMGSLGEQYKAQQASKEELRRGSLWTNRNKAIAAATAAGVVLIALVLALVVPELIPKSPEELYEADRYIIAEAILVVSSGYSPEPIKFHQLLASGDEKKDSYSTRASLKLGTANALKEADAGGEEITTLLELQSHPGGLASQVGTPSWEDVDGDGTRRPAGDKLFYHNASPEPTVDHWNTTPMAVKGTDYLVDSRDWFIDFDLLLKSGYIDKVPESASRDNSADGTGSYSWYVNKSFEVKSMLYTRPTADTDGFQGAYP